jgi:hypothetical protein
MGISEAEQYKIEWQHCLEENRVLAARLEDLRKRNHILRTRPDLPMTDEQKETFKRLEVRCGVLEDALVKFIHIGAVSLGEVTKATGLTIEEVYAINRRILGG